MKWFVVAEEYVCDTCNCDLFEELVNITIAVEHYQVWVERLAGFGVILVTVAMAYVLLGGD